MSGWKTYLRILLPYFYLMFINVGLINTQAALVCFLHTHTHTKKKKKSAKYYVPRF